MRPPTPEELLASDARLGPSVHLLWEGPVVRGRPVTFVRGRAADLQTALWTAVVRRSPPAGFIVRPTCGRALCVRGRHLRAEPPARAGYIVAPRLGIPEEVFPDLRPPGSTCARGHDLLDLAVLAWHRGKPRCRACTREWDAATAARAGRPRQYRQGADGRYLRCRRGHPLDGDNVMVEKTGIRRCRTCYLDKERRKRDKQREARTQAEPAPAPESVAS